MSVWHAIEGTDFGAGAPGVVLSFWPARVAFTDVTVSISDALSAPDEDGLADQAAILLPTGAAWGKTDGETLSRDTMLWRFWRAASTAMADAYRDGWGVTLESTSLTIRRSLGDWEADYGLPDPCVGLHQTDEQRLRWLREKVRSPGTITPADFLNLAVDLGYRVVIEEPVICEAGAFECGGPDEVGTPDGNHVVVFWILGAGEYGFEAGFSEAGASPLYDFDHAAAIECRFRELLPAGFLPVFDYSELTTFIGWPDAWLVFWE